MNEQRKINKEATAIILRSKAGEKRIVETVYKQQYKRCIACIRHWCHSSEEAKEVYQDAFLIFLEKIYSGKLKVMTCSIPTYLCAIEINILKQRKRMHNRFTNGEELLAQIPEDSESYSIIRDMLLDTLWICFGDLQDEDLDYDLGKTLPMEYGVLIRALEKLDEKCRMLLQLFYFKELSWKNIAAQMGYDNENTPRKKKYKCILRIRELLGISV